MLLYCLLNKFVKNDPASPGYLPLEEIQLILLGKIAIPVEFYNYNILSNYITAVENLRYSSPPAINLKFVKNADNTETITCLIYDNKLPVTTHLHNLEIDPSPVYIDFIAARDLLLSTFKITRYATKYVEVDNLVILDDFDKLNTQFKS